MKKSGIMKKALFVLGILFLLFGLMIGNPDGMRDSINRIDDDTRKADFHDHFNNTYNQTHDYLGDNTDVGAYGIAMLGILIILVSVTRRKDKGAGLLYQSEQKQQINPADLEKKLKKNLLISTPEKSDEVKKDLFELPDLELPGPVTVKKKHHKIKQPIAQVGSNGHDLHHQNGTEVTAKTSNGSTTYGGTASDTPPVTPPERPEMKSASCPDCGEVVNISENITDILCPGCGKKYQVA